MFTAAKLCTRLLSSLYLSRYLPKQKLGKIIVLSLRTKAIIRYIYFLLTNFANIPLTAARIFRNISVRCHFSLASAKADQTSANQEQKETDFTEHSIAGTAGGLSLLCISKFLLYALSSCSFKKLLRKGAALIASCTTFKAAFVSLTQQELLSHGSHRIKTLTWQENKER